MSNPPPGTVVDSSVTKPEWYDFFLISQSVRQGTVTPVSLNVVLDFSGKAMAWQYVIDYLTDFLIGCQKYFFRIFFFLRQVWNRITFSACLTNWRISTTTGPAPFACQLLVNMLTSWPLWSAPTFTGKDYDGGRLDKSHLIDLRLTSNKTCHPPLHYSAPAQELAHKLFYL